MNDMINYNSPKTYDEYPQEYDNIAMIEDSLILKEHIDSEYYEIELIDDHFPPT